jgi:hypothetical protein
MLAASMLALLCAYRKNRLSRNRRRRRQGKLQDCGNHSIIWTAALVNPAECIAGAWCRARMQHISRIGAGWPRAEMGW